jgi:hypothetical protein
LDHPLTILPDQAIEIVAVARKVMVGRVKRSAYWLNHDPSGLIEAGLRSGDQMIDEAAFRRSKRCFRNDVSEM